MYWASRGIIPTHRGIHQSERLTGNMAAVLCVWAATGMLDWRNCVQWGPINSYIHNSNPGPLFTCSSYLQDGLRNYLRGTVYLLYNKTLPLEDVLYLHTFKYSVRGLLAKGLILYET